MPAGNLEQEVRALIADIVEMEPDQIAPDAHLIEDLGMDSMMALEILAGIEKKYKIQVPEEKLVNLKNLNEAIEGYLISCSKHGDKIPSDDGLQSIETVSIPIFSASKRAYA